MMKKSVHILFLCLFFLLGLQCTASTKKTSSLPCSELSKTSISFSCKSFYKQEKSTAVISSDKLLKKRRFSKTQQNAITSLSKCKGFGLGAATISSSKFLAKDYSKFCNSISEYSFYRSFCYRKLLSIFYSFQAFW